jgi:hypothetical protein
MKTWILVVILGLLVVQACASDVQSSEGLFISVDAPLGVTAPGEPTIMRTRYVDIQFALLEGMDASSDSGSGGMSAVQLNLFDDAIYQVVFDQVEFNSPEGYTWLGHLEGVENSQVTLVVENKVMAGNITLPDAFYQVRYVGEGVHAVYQIDQSAYPPEAEPIPVP